MNKVETKIGQQIIKDQPLDFNSLPKNRPSSPIDINIDLSILTPKELIERNIRTERLENIDIEQIYIDFGIVDKSHAEELGKSMKEDRGQLMPILVRARLEEDVVRYDIIDGFHRTLGKIKEGFKGIDAKVIYSCSDQELYDLRILAANSVKSVQFARLAQWITSSFETSGFAKHIDVCQAFGLTINDCNRSYVASDLSPEKIEELKKWVIKKSKVWERTPSAIYQDLRIISVSNPELVKIVKDANSGKERAKYLTKEKLKQIAERYPGEKNYHIQKLIVDYVIKHKLQTTHVRPILDNLETRHIFNLPDEEITKIISSTKFEVIEKKTRSKKPKIDRVKPKIELENPEIEKLKSQLKQALTDISQKDAKIAELEHSNGNNEVVKDIINKLSNWVNNPKYSLSKTEKQIIQLFLYRPDLNIFKVIKGIANNTQTTALILSAINKKLIIDDENRHS